MFGIYCLAFWYAGQLVMKGENTFKEVLKVGCETSAGGCLGGGYC
jgi:hypothetical protein